MSISSNMQPSVIKVVSVRGHRETCSVLLLNVMQCS